MINVNPIILLNYYWFRLSNSSLCMFILSAFLSTLLFLFLFISWLYDWRRLWLWFWFFSLNWFRCFCRFNHFRCNFSCGSCLILNWFRFCNLCLYRWFFWLFSFCYFWFRSLLRSFWFNLGWLLFGLLLLGVWVISLWFSYIPTIIFFRSWNNLWNLLSHNRFNLFYNLLFLLLLSTWWTLSRLRDSYWFWGFNYRFRSLLNRCRTLVLLLLNLLE